MFQVVPKDELVEVLKQTLLVQIEKVQKDVVNKGIATLQKDLVKQLSLELKKEIALEMKKVSVIADELKQIASTPALAAPPAASTPGKLRRHFQESAKPTKGRHATKTHPTKREKEEQLITDITKHKSAERLSLSGKFGGAANAAVADQVGVRDLHLRVGEHIAGEYQRISRSAVPQPYSADVPSAALLSANVESSIGLASIELAPQASVEEAVGWRAHLERWVISTEFENIASAMVMLNAMFLGLEANLVATHNPQPLFTGTTEILFCVIFLAELCLRVWCYGCWDFFLGDFWWLGWFDAGLVVIQVMDLVLRMFPNIELVSELGAVRALRMFRVLRIARALRVLHLNDILYATIAGMTSSIGPASWALAIFLLMVYIFSVILLQIVLSSYPNGDLPSSLSHWFGSLPLTILTMFQCFVGGADWVIVSDPLMESISPLMGVVFSIFVSIALFVVMNLIMTVFAQKVVNTAREDRDDEAANSLRDVFAASQMFQDSSPDEEITWEVFAAKLAQPAMVEYFRSIDVTPCVSDARGLFELIDEDRNGTLSSQEMVTGCLRLRGPARALDLALLNRIASEQASTIAKLGQSITGLTAQLEEERRQHKDVLDEFTMGQTDTIRRPSKLSGGVSEMEVSEEKR